MACCVYVYVRRFVCVFDTCVHMNVVPKRINTQHGVFNRYTMSVSAVWSI